MSADEVTDTADNKPTIIAQLRSNPWVPLIVGVAIAVALIAGMFFWAMGPNYATLYSGLTPTDGGNIIAELDKMNIPYQLTAGGTTISVPREEVDSTRLKLASAGLPNSAGVGFELMDNQSFGISQFAEHINFMRALQGELARSIETMDAVSSARVHLAIPRPSVFVRKTAKPTASVVLDLYRGRSLSQGQINAITHLVSSAVTRLPVDNITVVDAHGDLLTKPDGNDSGFSGNQLDYVARIENDYRKRIEHILAPVVGRDNIRAQVSVDVDFSTGERTEQEYKPNQGDAAVRSKQVNLSRQDGGKFIGGVPGSLSNRPDADVPSPIVNPDNPNAAGKGNTNRNGGQQNGTDQNTGDQTDNGNSDNDSSDDDDKGSASRSATVNYEVNEIIRHIKEDTGKVAHVSAAVVVNYAMQPGKDDDGSEGEDAGAGPLQPSPLSEERMQQIRSLVKQAVGFSNQRGDTISVVNVPFEEQNEPVATTSWWQNPTLIAMLIKGLQWLLVIIVALLLWFKLVKPLLRRVPMFTEPTPQPATAGGPQSFMEDENEGDISDAEAERRRQRNKKYADLMESAQEYAKDDPKLMAMIIKGWLKDNG